jgi:hypothetical protein
MRSVGGIHRTRLAASKVHRHFVRVVPLRLRCRTVRYFPLSAHPDCKTHTLDWRNQATLTENCW